MNRTSWFSLLAGACGLVLCVALVTAQEKKQEPPKPAPPGQKATTQPAGQPGMPSQEEMQKMMQLMQPGPEHKELQKIAGKWNFQMKWWRDPNSPPMSSKGTCENKSIFGGRYIEQTVLGEPTPPMTQEFHGLGIMGYDNVTKKYFFSWIDDMGTGVMVGYGTKDPAGKTITYTGEMSDPEKGRPVKFREIIRIVSDDEHVMEFWSPDAQGKDFKSGEIRFTRAD